MPVDSQQTALTVYKEDVVMKISSDLSGDSLIKAIETDGELKIMLQNQERGFVSVNVEETMTSLIQVSDLLRLAFAGSKGLPCSTLILGMQSDYQDLVKMSMVTTGAFLRTSLSAVGFHANAITMFEEAMKPENEASQQDLIDSAMEMLQQCSTVAKDMAGHCDLLIKKCDDLIKQSKESLLAANNDSNATAVEKKGIEEKFAQMEALQAELKTKKDDYVSAIEKYDKDQQRLDDKAEKAMWVDMAATVVSGLIQASASVASAAVAVYGGPQAQIAKTAGTLAKSSAGSSSEKAAPGSEASASSNEQAQSVLVQSEQKAKNEAASKENKKQLEEAEKKLAEEKAKVKALESSGDSADIDKKKAEFLEKQINGLKEESKNLADARKKIEEAGKALSESLGKVSDKAEKQADSLSARAQAAGDKAYEFRKLKAQIAGELEKVVITLAAMQVSKNTVDKTLASLEVVLVVLGRIKTAFSNTKVFWQGVEVHCKSLSGGASAAEMFKKTIKVSTMRTKLMQTVKCTALSWMALSHINYRAYKAMKLAGANVDKAMSNIPGANECDAIVSKLGPQILSQIQAERIAENSVE
ncbi:MAG: hypothetical protein V7K77_13775 [Nostoc sp.]|uniref:hypothetical protein n=1 Tax=Nostoc sp. TaxID=1180 RepID=UPI002FFA7B53